MATCDDGRQQHGQRVDSLQLMFGDEPLETSTRAKVNSGTHSHSNERKSLSMGDILGNLDLLAVLPKKQAKKKKGRAEKKTSAAGKKKERTQNKVAQKRKHGRGPRGSKAKQEKGSNANERAGSQEDEEVRHEVFVVPCEQNVQAAFVQKTTVKGSVKAAEASCTKEFLGSFSKAEYAVDCVCSRRHGSGSNTPMTEKAGSVCIWKQLVKLPKCAGATSICFDHEKEGRAWGEKLTEGLNSFYSSLASGPFTYGGLVADFCGVASFKSVLLDKDVNAIIRALDNTDVS